jgi:hypothetical protein
MTMTIEARAAVHERGSALLLVLVLLVVLLAGGAVALYVQNADTRAGRVIRETRESLYCAESGLAASRLTLAADMSLWPSLIDADATNDPTWYPVRGDLDDPPDGVDDYEVTIEDNNDEAAPTANDLNVDTDAQVFIVSRCIKNPEVPREVIELISFQAAGHVYRNQSGQGAGNTGNAN